ncbi:hypothetical protein SLS60_006331 [Paraconiothyrium brasiliense]|uniref:Uncharacterized protein n=1 Tax=Paraconiothyrium brasiliense TaxID=300254 RepID=A0ABR3RAG2_9PLEO
MWRHGASVDESLIHRAFSLLPLADLLREEKSWDFRDSFVSLVQSDPGQELLSKLFGAGLSVYLIDTVLKEWEGYAPHSEVSTKLAFLDMAESVLFESSPNDESWRLLDKATEIMSSLIQRDEALTKYRQYIRWILLKVAYEAHGRREALTSPPAGNPGISRTKLKRDITSLGHPSGFLPSLRWTRAMILRALSASDVEEWGYFKEAEVECMLGPHNLPSTCLAFTTKVSRLSHFKYHPFNKREEDIGMEKDGFNGYHTTLRRSGDGMDVAPVDQTHEAEETRSALARERHIASEKPETEQQVEQKDIKGARQKPKADFQSPRANLQEQDNERVKRTKKYKHLKN